MTTGWDQDHLDQLEAVEEASLAWAAVAFVVAALVLPVLVVAVGVWIGARTGWEWTSRLWR